MPMFFWLYQSDWQSFHLSCLQSSEYFISIKRDSWRITSGLNRKITLEKGHWAANPRHKQDMGVTKQKIHAEDKKTLWNMYISACTLVPTVKIQNSIMVHCTSQTGLAVHVISRHCRIAGHFAVFNWLYEVVLDVNNYVSPCYDLQCWLGVRNHDGNTWICLAVYSWILKPLKS